MVRFLIITVILSLPSYLFSQRGKDGSKTVSTTNLIVNEYTTLTSDITAGSDAITVNNNNLNVNGRFSGALSTGDLIMIIQVQGATINGSATDIKWGEIVNYNNCGNYEFQQVKSVTGGNNISFDCTIEKNYSASGKTLVIRIPRYASLTINPGASISCPPWDGNIGGVCAIEIEGSALINGSIHANNRGFRGGQIDPNSNFGYAGMASLNDGDGGEKGEGIAGYQSEYDIFGGRYGRGAPANGGGGGNNHNSAGGGGANGGITSQWKGTGVPDISNPGWAAAWELEYAGFSTAVSYGGGKGGYSWGDWDMDATTQGPGDLAWGLDGRRNVGGLGGRPLDQSTGRIFMGGGGGAGDQNNSFGGRGGNGGGIVYIIAYGPVSGSGSVSSNGENGIGACCSSNNGGIDASGGGGGGGSIVVKTYPGNNSINTLSAIGGNGGTQDIKNGNHPTESEGPGGGGGGGYIEYTSPASIGSITNGGGVNGTTNSGGVMEFPHNGATSGKFGSDKAIPGPLMVSGIGDTICLGNSSTITATLSGQIPPNTNIIWFDRDAGGNIIGNGTSFTSPPLFNDTTYYAGTCPGTFRIPVKIKVIPSPSSGFTAPNVCFNNSTNIQNSGTTSNTYYWNFGEPTSGSDNTSTLTSPSHTYGNPGTFNITLIASTPEGCSDTTTTTVLVYPLPTADFSPTTACVNDTINFIDKSFISGSSIVSWSWNFDDSLSGGNNISTAQNSHHLFSNTGKYDVLLSVTSKENCISNVIKPVTILPLPDATFSATDVCFGKPTQFTFNGNGNTTYNYQWDFGDGVKSNSMNPQHIYASMGTFTVTLTIDNSYCINTSVVLANVLSGPIANFNINPESTNILSTQIDLFDLSVNANTGIWNFGDGTTQTYTGSDISHTFPDAENNEYVISLIVESNGCIDTAIKKLEIKPLWTLYMPDAFSPNNDLFNDNFYGKGYGITEFEMWIFDRWGNEIYHCNVEDVPQNSICHWNGKVQNGSSNEMAQQDVYVWLIEFTDIFNDSHKEIGHVTLVK